jgi:Asparagine synthase
MFKWFLQVELQLQVKALHLYDCLRANKATSAWGLEVRVPFLDKEFINVAMSIDPEWKMVTSLHHGEKVPHVFPLICSILSCILTYVSFFTDKA